VLVKHPLFAMRVAVYRVKTLLGIMPKKTSKINRGVNYYLYR